MNVCVCMYVCEDLFVHSGKESYTCGAPIWEDECVLGEDGVLPGLWATCQQWPFPQLEVDARWIRLASLPLPLLQTHT